MVEFTHYQESDNKYINMVNELPDLNIFYIYI